MNGGQEVPGDFVISCGDRPELLKLGEEILDEMTGLIEMLVEFPWLTPVGFGWNDGGLPGFFEGEDNTLVRVIGFIGDDLLCRDLRQEVISAREIMYFSSRQMKPGWVAQRVDRGMDLRAQSASGSSNGLVFTSFFCAPALC